MIVDIDLTVASLYDGGWRSEDHDELMRLYGFTKEEADEICEIMSSYEE